MRNHIITEPVKSHDLAVGSVKFKELWKKKYI